MPQWTDAAGKPSPFPTEAPPSSSIANFRKKEDALIGDLSGSIDAKNAAATEAVYTTKTTSELSITNQMELMKSLEGTGLSKSILSHQVAANTVHARELAALQLKYSTKNAELDAAHSTHDGAVHRARRGERVDEARQGREEQGAPGGPRVARRL